jgi:hypothetical protein
MIARFYWGRKVRCHNGAVDNRVATDVIENGERPVCP